MRRFFAGVAARPRRAVEVVAAIAIDLQIDPTRRNPDIAGGCARLFGLRQWLNAFDSCALDFNTRFLACLAKSSDEVHCFGLSIQYCSVSGTGCGRTGSGRTSSWNNE